MKKKFLLLVTSALCLSSASVSAQFNPTMTRSGTTTEWVVNFFRVNNPSERLYEDANSVYSVGKGLNYLGVEGKGDEKNTAMLVKYTRGKVMPQYLIMLGKSVTEETEYLCPECQDPDCTHSKKEIGFTSARFLVNLTDSVEYYKNNTEKQSLFRWNGSYTRLAFVEGKMYGDTVVVIQNSAKGEAKENRINVADVNEKGEGVYCPVLFSFRLLNGDEPDGDFLIESTGKAIASTEGQWIKIQNGVPVVVDTTVKEAVVHEAEWFNIEYVTNDPVPNAGLNPARIQISGDYGRVTIKGAAGKSVVISNTLGQILVKKELQADEESIPVSAGVAVVQIEGKEATKVLVK